MKLVKTCSLVVGTALAIAGATVTFGGPASATTTVDPAITGDPNAANGSITFYDAGGNVITSGNDLHSIFIYAAASSAGRPGTTKGTAYFAFPDHTKTDSTTWFENQETASTTYPNSSAPAPVNGLSNPVATADPSSGGADLAAILPTTTTDSTTGFADIVQVRLYDTGPGISRTAPFWATDISYDSGAGTWQQVYPAVVSSAVSTTTTLAAAPATSTTQGQSVTLTATVTATDASAPTGSVQFQDGATNLGAPVAVTPGAGSSTASKTWASSTIGAHALHAVFTPTSTAAYDGSTGDLSYSITAATPTYKPTLYGTVRVGSTVACVASFDYATSVSYTWLRDGVSIGVTTSSYKIADALYNHLLSCRVVATNGSGGPTTTGTSSAAKVAIGPALVATRKPYLYNKNSTHLTTHGTYEYVSPGAWSPTATSYTYQWYVGTTAIRGATGSRYLIPSTWKGKSISCVVTAHRASWTNGAVRTASTTVR